MAIAVEMNPEVRRSSSAKASDAMPLSTSTRRNSTLFRRVSAQAMGMEHDSLCHKSHWVPKSSRDTCSNCKRGFRVFHAKHNCRLCGEVVCGACSTKRILFQKKSVRSCDECVNQSVESISRFNRRSSTSGNDVPNYNSSDDTSDTHRRSSQQFTKRNSESDLVARHPARTPASVALSRRRGQSQPIATTSSIATTTTTIAPIASIASKHVYRPVPRVESWRMQLPYVIVFFLMTVAGITNVLALTA